MDPTAIAGKYELLMHSYALVLPLTTAMIGATNEMFFNEERLCWFGDVCKSHGDCPDGNNWGRGYLMVVITAAFTYINLTGTILCMVIIYWTLRQINTAMQRHAFQPQVRTVRQRELSHTEFAAKECFRQALLYFGAYVLTYMWGVIYIAVNVFDDTSSALNQPWYSYFQGMFQPLQGFWNFFAYVRPRVSAMQRREHGTNVSFFSALKKIMIDDSGGTMERRVPIRRATIDIRNMSFALDSGSEDTTHEDDTEEDDITPPPNEDPSRVNESGVTVFCPKKVIESP